MKQVEASAPSFPPLLLATGFTQFVECLTLEFIKYWNAPKFLCVCLQLMC